MLCSTGLCPYSLCIAVALLFYVKGILFRSSIRWVTFLPPYQFKQFLHDLNEFSTSVLPKPSLNTVDAKCLIVF
jgi:hypothetical protein